MQKLSLPRRLLCRVHNVEMICFCPACAGVKGGLSRSKAKGRASRRNGKLGGRPKKDAAQKG